MNSKEKALCLIQKEEYNRLGLKKYKVVKEKAGFLLNANRSADEIFNDFLNILVELGYEVSRSNKEAGRLNLK